jgi:hypothetical protein
MADDAGCHELLATGTRRKQRLVMREYDGKHWVARL